MGVLSIHYFSLGYRIFRQMTKWQSSSEVSATRSAKAEQFKTRLYFHLENHYSDCEYNVARLSRDMGMSRSQLFRKCKLLTGQSPVAQIKQFRLHKARGFLKSGIYNVSEAAYLSGFNSLSYFSKSFKKKYRQMPSKWVA